MNIRILSAVILCFTTVSGRIILNQNAPFEENNMADRFQRNDVTETSDGGIRIRINANGESMAPFIMFRRQPDTDLRLRIQRNMNADEPFRILYGRNQPTISNSEERFNQGVAQAQGPRFIVNSNDQSRTGRIILQSLMPTNIRISPGQSNM